MIKIDLRVVLFFLISLFILQDAFGQSRSRRHKKKIKRFNAGAVVGLNLSQLDGDELQGYDKGGISFGLIGTARLNEQLDFNVELLYSQKGSKSGALIDRDRFSINPFKIKLVYAEAPILLNYKFKEKEDRYRGLFQFGFSFSRLLNSKVEERILEQDQIEYANFEEDFKRNDINTVLGIGYFFSESIGVSLRHNFSLIPLFESKTEISSNSIIIRSYHLSLRLFYMLK